MNCKACSRFILPKTGACTPNMLFLWMMKQLPSRHCVFLWDEKTADAFLEKNGIKKLGKMPGLHLSSRCYWCSSCDLHCSKWPKKSLKKHTGMSDLLTSSTQPEGWSFLVTRPPASNEHEDSFQVFDSIWFADVYVAVWMLLKSRWGSSFKSDLKPFHSTIDLVGHSWYHHLSI